MSFDLQLSDKGKPSVIEEVCKVFTSMSTSGFDPRNPIERREKGKGGKKKAAASKYLPPSKRRNVTVFKNVVVFKYMGPNCLSEFMRTAKVVVYNFFHQLDTTATAEEILVGLVNLIKNAECPEHDFSSLTGLDLEFVKCSGKNCRIPQTAVEFEWNGEAVKSLCGQGDLCIRLRSDFSKHVPEVSDDIDSDDPSEVTVEVYDTQLPTVGIPSPNPCSSTSLTSSTSPVDDSKPGPSSVVDLTHLIDLTSYSPPYSPQSADELPEVPLRSAVATDDLYRIFSPAFSTECVDTIVELSVFDRTNAMNFLISGPTASGLLQLLRQKEYNCRAEKITIQDEDDLLEEAVVHYKHPSFKPLSPVRVSFKGQPAIDTGGVTRQFFSDVLRCFVDQDLFQLFVGHPEHLRLAYSPQVLPLLKILGLIIGHSLVHEGPGFPSSHHLSTGILRVARSKLRCRMYQ